MNAAITRQLGCVLGCSLLWLAAAGAAQKPVDIHVYVNDSCIIADEPYFVPAASAVSGPETPKFLPLIGVIIGKLAELFINHEVQDSANQIKSGAARKDTRYAITKQMNLYRADLTAAPTLSINAKLGCMTIVAAKLQPEPADCTAAYVPKELARETMGLPEDQWKTLRADDSIENQLRRANVCVEGSAAAVYEARFEFSKDGTAYRMKDAGYRINSLLTTQDKGATRSAFYTLKISQPAATDQEEALSTAWVNLGTITVPGRSSGKPGDALPWLRVPPLTVEARRVYEEQTKTNQEVMGEIEALKRAMTRNQRVLDGLDQRVAGANAEVAAGLKQERTKVAVQIQTQSAELDARNAEFQDLAHSPLEFMPVTIEVSVTESESEKKEQLALADIIHNNSGVLASAVGSAASGLVSRSLNTSASSVESEPLRDAAALARARAQYFDVLVDAQTLPSGAPSDDSQRRLSAAKTQYNEARRSFGLEPIQ